MPISSLSRPESTCWTGMQWRRWGQPPRLAQVRDYVDAFLLRNGIRAEMVLHVRGSGSMTALISAVDTDSAAFDARDRAIAEILGLHLGNLLRGHTGEPVHASPISDMLSARQAEVVALLACGLFSGGRPAELRVRSSRFYSSEAAESGVSDHDMCCATIGKGGLPVYPPVRGGTVKPWVTRGRGSWW